MISISEIKSRAWSSLSGRWGTAIITLIIYIILVGVANIIPLGNILIGGPLAIGLTMFFLLLAKGREAKVETIFRAFNDYGNALLVYFLNFIIGLLAAAPLVIYIVIWALSNSADLEADMISASNILGFIVISLILLIIPIYVQIRLALMFYIVADNSKVPADKALELSWKMMAQHIWTYIVLFLSFILWYLLSIITLGIALLWLIPYFSTSVAHFYLELKKLYPQYADIIDNYGVINTNAEPLQDMYLNKDE